MSPLSPRGGRPRSGGRPGPSGRRLLTAIIALCLNIGLLAGLAQPARAAAPVPPPVIPAAAAAQCGLGFGVPSSADAASAAAVMAGTVDLGRYGRFTLKPNPAWGYEHTLDTSGNTHVHSLHYLLPLLRDGIARNDHAMVARFYAVLYDWVHDNPPTTADASWRIEIVEGYRALTLVCAAAGPQGQAPWLRQALVTHGAWFADPKHYLGLNNSALHQSMGLLAIGSALGRADWQRLAVARMGALASRLVRADGSDGEGAPAYAIDNYQWLAQAHERVTRVGLAVPPSLAATDSLPEFIAHATRPDFRLEALGDSLPSPLSASIWAGTAAEWSATGGRSGTPPTRTFASYQGGYVFGRSGWGATRAPQDETFYSLRAGARSGLPHAHDDAASMTLYAYGSPLLTDTGQWRYLNGTTRSFVVGRSSHNAILVDGVARSSVPAPVLTTATTGDIDLVTIVDRAYRGVTLTRTVAYDRAHEVFVVWDSLSSAKPVTASQQWNLTRNRTVDLGVDAVTTGGAGANLRVLFAAGSDRLDSVAGAKAPMRGWSSLGYNELAAAPSVRSTQVGRDLSWVTVLAPAPGAAPTMTAAAQSDAASATVSVTPVGAEPFTVALTRTAATVGAGTVALTPTMHLGGTVVRPSTPVTVRFAGVASGSPAVLESLSDDGAWARVADLTAGPAGTGRLTVAPETTSTYRITAADRSSAPTTITVGAAPAAPRALTASVAFTGTGKATQGRVTLRWSPPAPAPGQLPVTGYTIAINGQSVRVPATTLAALFTRVQPGRLPATVVAHDAIGTSRPVAVSVKVAH